MRMVRWSGEGNLPIGSSIGTRKHCLNAGLEHPPPAVAHLCAMMSLVVVLRWRSVSLINRSLVTSSAEVTSSSTRI